MEHLCESRHPFHINARYSKNILFDSFVDIELYLLLWSTCRKRYDSDVRKDIIYECHAYVYKYTRLIKHEHDYKYKYEYDYGRKHSAPIGYYTEPVMYTYIKARRLLKSI